MIIIEFNQLGSSSFLLNTSMHYHNRSLGKMLDLSLVQFGPRLVRSLEKNTWDLNPILFDSFHTTGICHIYCLNYYV